MFLEHKLIPCGKDMPQLCYLEYHALRNLVSWMLSLNNHKLYSYKYSLNDIISDYHTKWSLFSKRVLKIHVSYDEFL